MEIFVAFFNSVTSELDILSSDTNLYTPLHVAAAEGHTGFVNVLLEAQSAVRDK